MNPPTLKLPRNADELLLGLPVAEPDFEAQAKTIEARLKGSPGGVVFDDLLRTPELTPEPGEQAAASSSRAAAAPKSNFAEMARKSVQKKDDDQAQLTKELLAATAQSRRPNAEMVERVRAAGRASATSTPLPSEPGERTSGVVARTVDPAPKLAAVRAPGSTKTHPGTIIGIAGAAIAVAACVALFMKTGQSETPTSAALAAEKAADAPAAATPRAAAAPALVAKPNEGVVSPEQLAQASQAAPVTPKAGAAKVAAAAPMAAAPGSKAAPPPVSVGAKEEHVELQEDAPPPQPVAQAPKAETAPEPAMKPAEGSAASVPLNPSAGAVSTAISSVRGGAQACLAGQTDPVSAVVTFAADGHVLRVSAAGPSGACIQAALSKAHVAPFAKETFSASITIRPP